MVFRYVIGVDVTAGEAADPDRLLRGAELAAQEIEYSVPGVRVGVRGSLDWRKDWNKDRKRVQLHVVAPDAAVATRFVNYASQADKNFNPASDPLIQAAEVWPTNGTGGQIFGTRTMAHALIGADTLAADMPDNWKPGEGVNVVICDKGISREWLRQEKRDRAGQPNDNDGFGWTRYRLLGERRRRAREYLNPGEAASVHGHMLARTVLALAPHATIWDVPLVPGDDEPDGPPPFSAATAILLRILGTLPKAGGKKTIKAWDYDGGPKIRETDKGMGAMALREVSGHWIFLNAWFVPEGPELEPLLKNEPPRFSDDPNNKLLKVFPRLSEAGIDVVFAAGNCGDPSPDDRCKAGSTGPGRSIFGASSHPDVLTVGAVRADGLPVGLSAQGPGRLAARGYREDPLQRERAREKPDLCAPSHFRDDRDRAVLDGGTSSACAVAAGVLAILRSAEGHLKQQRLTPAQMRKLLRKTAGRSEWDPRLGYGVLNAGLALSTLKDPAKMKEIREA